MSDLRQVKAEVKAWEKAFKAANGRDPVKADIKAEPEIAAKYAEYRRLTKEGSTGVKRDSTGRPKAGPSESVPIASPVFTTPRKPKPSTSFETPKSQRSSNPFASPAALSRSGAVRDTAAAPAGGSSRRPIHDPSPVNPFASPSQSTYIYAESPKKFKALLEAGSAHKRAIGFAYEVTPRTRARKRLRGEPVEDTPGKPKARTVGRLNSLNGAGAKPPAPSRQTSASSRGSAMSDLEDNEDEDEALGPTPVKPAANGTNGHAAAAGAGARPDGRFQLFFDEVDKPGPPSPLRGMRLFHRASDEAGPPREDPSGSAEDLETLPQESFDRSSSAGAADLMGSAAANVAADGGDQAMEDVSGNLSPLPDVAEADTIPEADPLSPRQATPDPRMVPDALLAHDIEISSDEGDEQEAGGSASPVKVQGRTKLRIASSRLVTQQRIARSEHMLQRFGPRASPLPDKPVNELEGDVKVPIAPTLGFASLALSPTSKVVRRTLALQESRARAVFDAHAAQKIKLAKQAPVWLPGEADQEVGSDGEAVEQDDSTADDDWESDAEGWKATGLPDDDDW